MHGAKHMRKTRPSAKLVAWILAAVVLLSATVGGVYAYILAQAPSLTNRFDPVKVTCAVEESFDGVTKEHVAVRNTGDIPAYIRAALVFTWVDDDGKVSATAPMDGIDYTVVWGDSRWVKGSDGYWYYREAVSPQMLTADLIRLVTAAADAPRGYHLQVQVIATAIQATPADAVQEAWGVTVTDGMVTPA